ncbi:5-formyltetrahydrofolate cyclo-ligase, mitochondrial [Linum perenne]
MNAIDFYPNIRMPRPSKSSVSQLISTVNKLSPFNPTPTASISSLKSSFPPLSAVNMSSDAPATNSGDLEAVFQDKRSLRSKIRKALKGMDSAERARQDEAIQGLVLEAPWFKASKSLCAYISCPSLREVDTAMIVSEAVTDPYEGVFISFKKRLYLPRVEDMNSNMRMLRVSNIDDLILNSMNILEPSVLDSDGNRREDVLLAREPVDLFIIPGLAFDRSGRRLGRSGGYYDVFLKKYQSLAKERNWKPPLHVALAYSVQITEERSVPVTSNDVPVDGIVSPSGFISISPAAHWH